MMAKNTSVQAFLALCAFVAASADHNYLLVSIYLGDSCSGDAVHYYVYGYDMTGNLNKPADTHCDRWVDGSGGIDGYGAMEITGAHPVESGTAAYTILAKKFSSEKCSFESYSGHDFTAVVAGKCTKVNVPGSYSYMVEYHDTAPQLPAGKEFVVEAFYESKATCLGDTAPENKLMQYSYARAFSLDVCIPIYPSSSGKYTPDKMLSYYASPDCSGPAAATLGPLADVTDKCDSQKDTDPYPGLEGSDWGTYARNNQYHYQAYVTKNAAKGPKMPKGGAKSKAKQ